MKPLGELTKEARTDTIPEFLEFVSSWAKQAGYSEKRVKEIGSAVTEALTNIAEFICREGGQSVTMQCGDDKGRRFVIEIFDSGKPFNMLLEADPFLSGNDPSEKRPSVRFMKKIGDVEYKRFEGKNRIVITTYPEFNLVKNDSPG